MIRKCMILRHKIQDADSYIALYLILYDNQQSSIYARKIRKSSEPSLEYLEYGR